MDKPQKPFKGELARKKDRLYLLGGILNTLSPEYARMRQADLADTLHKLSLLYEHYEIDPNEPDRDASLVLAMARDFVPGFQYKPPSGRPTKWTFIERGLLAADIEYTAANNGRKQSITWACRKLAASAPWRGFLGQRKGRGSKAAPDQALREVYKQAKADKFASVCRDLCAKTVRFEGPVAWRELVASMLEEKVRNVNSKKS